MDIATIVGLLAAFGLIFMAISENAPAFVDTASMLIVVAGSIAVVMARSSLGEFLGAIGVMGKAFSRKIDDPVELITQIVELANIARKDGLIALEGQDIKNQFLSKGIGLLVDSTPADIIDSSLENELTLMKSRHENAALMYRSWADIAPAMGMIGTLCGLVGMLQAMDDPKAIGPAMAIALLTTLYGALIANVIAKPIAEKLEGYSKDETENCELIIEGIRHIQNGTNPRSMADLLATRLAPKERAALEGL